MNVADEINRKIAESTGLVVLLGGADSSWQQTEVEAAIRIGLPIVPITYEDRTLVPPLLRKYRSLHIPKELLTGDDEKAWLKRGGDQLIELANRASPRVTVDPDDPHRGQWGGKAVSAGRQLLAQVTAVEGIDRWFTVDLSVARTGGDPLTGDVMFYLHPRIEPSIRRATPHEDTANIAMRTWGAFTVGATTDAGTVRLELDLASLPDAPQIFRDH